MTDEERDRAYTALCNAMAQAGEDQAELFLAMMCLGLMERHDCETVLALIDRIGRSIKG